MTGDSLVRIRALLMGFAGLVCLTYALLAVIMGRPDPLFAYLPGLVGVGSGVAIFVAFRLARSGSIQQARDEIYRLEHNKAQAIGFWVAVFMYPIFAPFLMAEWTTYQVAFAAMGTFTAAAYLLSFAVFSLRGV